ncbi:MAG: hypothetical protein NTU73_07020 [Ignavibacteriae bacterium]|nr:hypothetical protein [Ignavibacteriota bacterium]
MWINSELKRLSREPNYKLAYDVFSSIISKTCPDINLLKRLYGEKRANIIFDNIRNYFIREKRKILISRIHNYENPLEIINARRKIEKNIHFQKIQYAILQNELPSKSNLEIFYGSYTDFVFNIIDIYKRLNLKRKCELNAATHLSRVGAVVYQLNMNDEGTHKYSSIAMMHDAVEDLLDYSKLSKNNKIHIDYYNSFLDDFIPKDLQQPVKILTNHYNFIINYIVERLKDKDKSVSIKNILLLLEKMLKLKLGDLNEYIKKMYNLLSYFEPEGDLIVSAKWECYKSLYLNGIAEACKNYDDYRLFEIKGVDLSDNAHGKGALSTDAKIRNINKNMLWGIIGYRMQSSWKPLNDKIEEIMEDSLQSAEALVLIDLLQTQSSQDFVMSALHKIKKLEAVFYT